MFKIQLFKSSVVTKLEDFQTIAHVQFRTVDYFLLQTYAQLLTQNSSERFEILNKNFFECV